MTFIYCSIPNDNNINFSEEKVNDETQNITPEIDNEGYCIQPSGQWSVDKGSFYSSSDSGKQFTIIIII